MIYSFPLLQVSLCQELSSQNGPLKESRVDLILLAATVVTTSANQSITLLPLGKLRSECWMINFDTVTLEA